jgi:hypothetical protein
MRLGASERQLDAAHQAAHDLKELHRRLSF